MSFTGKIEGLHLDLYTHKPILTIICNEEKTIKELADKYKDKEKLVFDVKAFRKRRSIDANSYMWLLCDEIAKVLGGKTTKEDVYRKAIRENGVFTFAMVQEGDEDKFISVWESNGIGWVAEKLDMCKVDGGVKIVMYHGSSTYDSKQMSDLIDYIVEEAQELGIDTKAPDEISNLKSLWAEKDKCQKA